MNIAGKYLEELLNLLTNEENEDLSPEELLEVVSLLIEDYKLDITPNEVVEELSSLTDEDIKKSEESGANIVIPPHVNKDFILSKATQQYFNQIGLDEDTFDAMPVGQKVAHRSAINKIFARLIQEEIANPTNKKIKSTLKKSPFKRIEGSGDEDNKKVEEEYYGQRLSTLKEELEIITRQIKDLRLQPVSWREDEVRILEQQKINIEKQITTYNSKI